MFSEITDFFASTDFKMPEPRDEIPVRYYTKLAIVLFILCIPLGLLARLKVSEVSTTF